MSSSDEIDKSSNNLHLNNRSEKDGKSDIGCDGDKTVNCVKSNIGEGSVDENLKLKSVEGSEKNDGHGSVIAAHYNTEDKGIAQRNRSRIVHLRNFNNWIKGMLLQEYLDLINNSKPVGSRMRALDLCCGKGGDLLKWKIGRIHHLVCCDIASVAIENCKSRYDDLKRRSRDTFFAEFIVADVTKTRIRGQYKDPSMRFDIVSCQFAFHYCFETLPQAECMLTNITECLKDGGYFIGTIPDANSIVSKQKAANCNEFGNDVFKITFDEDVTQKYPLFGAKYNFQLDGVVDCPEFLVHFPTFVKLADKYGLTLVEKMGFHNYYEKRKANGKFLLTRMSALEVYPPGESGKLAGSTDHYVHAKKFMEENKGHKKLGTLSQPEWEVADLYLIFVFQKKKAN